MLQSKNHFISFIPIIIGILAGFTVYYIPLPIISIKRVEFLLNTIITTSTTISGFILAAIAILAGASDTRIIVTIHQNSAHKELKWHCSTSLLLGLIQIIFFAGLGAITGENEPFSNLQVSIGSGLLIGYFASITLTCGYLVSIISFINDTCPQIDENPSTPSGEFRP